MVRKPEKAAPAELVEYRKRLDAASADIERLTRTQPGPDSSVADRVAHDVAFARAVRMRQHAEHVYKMVLQDYVDANYREDLS